MWKQEQQKQVSGGADDDTTAYQSLVRFFVTSGGDKAVANFQAWPLYAIMALLLAYPSLFAAVGPRSLRILGQEIGLVVLVALLVYIAIEFTYAPNAGGASGGLSPPHPGIFDSWKGAAVQVGNPVAIVLLGACLVPMTSALGSFGGSLGPLMAVVGAILLSILYVDWVVLRAATLEDGFWNFQKSLGDDAGVPIDPSGGKKE